MSTPRPEGAQTPLRPSTLNCIRLISSRYLVRDSGHQQLSYWSRGIWPKSSQVKNNLKISKVHWDSSFSINHHDPMFFLVYMKDVCRRYTNPIQSNLSWYSYFYDENKAVVKPPYANNRNPFSDSTTSLCRDASQMQCITRQINGLIQDCSVLKSRYCCISLNHRRDL